MKPKQVTTLGFFETIKQKVQKFATQYNINSALLIEGLGCFFFGLIIGFGIKKFGKALIFIILTLFIGLLVLSYGGIITIDWGQIQTMLGLPEKVSLEGFFSDFMVWAKNHLIGVIVGIIGFILGYKIG